MPQTDVYPLKLNFSQVIELFRRLPRRDKIRLSRVIEKDAVESRLETIHGAVKDNQLSASEIVSECRQARRSVLARKRVRARHS